MDDLTPAEAADVLSVLKHNSVTSFLIREYEDAAAPGVSPGDLMTRVAGANLAMLRRHFALEAERDPHAAEISRKLSAVPAPSAG